MRISSLCLAVSALFATSGAHALNVSMDGAGDAVLLPYYSLFDGQSAVFSITNHSAQPSVARVVVAEGNNGRAALTFNVYLAGNDSWSGALIAPAIPGPLSPPKLVTHDASCTSEPIAPEGTSLRTDGYTGSRADGLGDTAGRLYHGQMEVIELGRPTGAAALLVQQSDCEGLRARFAQNGVWSTDPNLDIAAQSGRISAQMQLIDVAAGVAFDIESLTLQGFSSGPRHGPGHTDFQAARIYKPTGDMEGEHPADAVSLLLMSADIEAAFSVEDSLDATTGLFITFPTRPAYLDNRPGGELAADTAPIAPFDDAEPSIANPTFSCVDTTWRALDRDGVVGEANEVPICTQVFGLRIAAGESEGPSTDGLAFFTGDVKRGRIRVDLDRGLHHRVLAYTLGPVENNAVAYGLPVMAASLIEVRNANAQPGVLASYAITGKAVRRRDGFVDF